MHDESKLLLRGIGLGPELAFLRQEDAADQQRQLLIARWHQLQRRVRVGKAERFGAVAFSAVWVDLGVYAAVDDVAENVSFENVHSSVVVLVDLGDQLRQPMGVLPHPVLGETRVAFLGARIGDALLVEGFYQPLVTADLLHTSLRAELLGQLGEYCVSLLLQLVTYPLSRGGGDTNAAPTHFVHHRQQINLEPIGRARAFLVEYWIEALE